MENEGDDQVIKPRKGESETTSGNSPPKLLKFKLTAKVVVERNDQEAIVDGPRSVLMEKTLPPLFELIGLATE